MLELDPSNSIFRKRYMPLVYGYNEDETMRKIEGMGQEISFHYQAGDTHVYLPRPITFCENGEFFIDERVVSSNIKRGCPLLVVFSNNQCYAIGMFQT